MLKFLEFIGEKQLYAGVNGALPTMALKLSATAEKMIVIEQDILLVATLFQQWF